MGKTVVIKAENVDKSFKQGGGFVKVLRGIDLEVHSGDYAVIFGPSGCGKSTLLNLVLGIDKPTSGEIKIRGSEMAQMPEDERREFRASKIGMVHQMPYWIKSLDVRHNTALPLIIKGEKQVKALRKADQLIHD